MVSEKIYERTVGRTTDARAMALALLTQSRRAKVPWTSTQNVLQSFVIHSVSFVSLGTPTVSHSIALQITTPFRLLVTELLHHRYWLHKWPPSGVDALERFYASALPLCTKALCIHIFFKRYKVTSLFLSFVPVLRSPPANNKIHVNYFFWANTAQSGDPK